MTTSADLLPDQGFDAWGWPHPWHKAKGDRSFCWQCEEWCSRTGPCDCCDLDPVEVTHADVRDRRLEISDRWYPRDPVEVD